jgi:hypothetical protein
MSSTTQHGGGDDVAAMILRWAVALLTSGFVSAVLLRRAMKAEAALTAEKNARLLAEAGLTAARDELAARAGERRLLGLAKRDSVPGDDEQRPSSTGIITGGKVVALRIRVQERRRRRLL